MKGVQWNPDPLTVLRIPSVAKFEAGSASIMNQLQAECTANVLRYFVSRIIDKNGSWLEGLHVYYILGLFTEKLYSKLLELDVVNIPSNTSSHATSVTSK